jgi:hypothetical protein
MTHTITPTPEQFAAIQRGEGIEIVERMEPQPDVAKRKHRWAMETVDGVCTWGRAPWRKTDPYNHIVEGKSVCPYALDDRIAVVCKYYDRIQGYCWHDNDADVQCFGRDLCSQLAAVTSIAPREIDGVWCWVVGCATKKEG